jgi:hypothetical protein
VERLVDGQPEDPADSPTDDHPAQPTGWEPPRPAGPPDRQAGRGSAGDPGLSHQCHQHPHNPQEEGADQPWPDDPTQRVRMAVAGASMGTGQQQADLCGIPPAGTPNLALQASPRSADRADWTEHGYLRITA